MLFISRLVCVEEMHEIDTFLHSVDLVATFLLNCHAHPLAIYRRAFFYPCSLACVVRIRAVPEEPRRACFRVGNRREVRRVVPARCMYGDNTDRSTRVIAESLLLL